MSERAILNLPQQCKPSHAHTASAPYNFVPLPEVVVTAAGNADDLPDHDRYYPDRHTGYFEVTLTTKSPLYVRCPFTLDEFLRHERDEDEQMPFQQQVKNSPNFFYTRDPSHPVIPGSSLRGMLRSLLEIVSYGKVQWVTDKRLFFRTVDDTAVGQYYNQRMVESLGTVSMSPGPSASGYRARVEGGFFRVRANGTFFIERCDVARVEVSDVLAAFGLSDRRELYQLGGRDLTPQNERNPNQTPKWNYQHRDIWADIDATEGDYFFPKQYRPHGGLRHPDLHLRFRRAKNIVINGDPGKAQGRLVLTGHMESKHMAFMFIAKALPDHIEVPNDPSEEDINKRLVDRFHDDEQITRWQSLAFANGQPPGANRQRDGHLRDGDPVFFLSENGQLTFFGRAQMFRLPYTQRPLDLVPPELHRPEDIDYAGALFGFVRTRKELEDIKNRGAIQDIPKQGDKKHAYAGRISVTDATLVEGQSDIWFPGDTIIVPKILATPKPTAFQHYLLQSSDAKNTLKHYDSSTPQETVIRGHKRYWHQALSTEQGLSLDQIRERIQEDRQRLQQILRDEQRTGRPDTQHTQHTQFKPIKPGVKFTFHVYFENLSDRELGSLCWALQPLGDPQKEYCHQLGMGKPLGMGTVKLEATLHLTNRTERYGSLFAGDRWQTGMSSMGEALSHRAVLERLTSDFEEHVLGALHLGSACQHLFELKRIGMLLKMMEWPGFGPDPSGDGFLTPHGRPNTRYMMIQPTNEYRDRPVLPDPSAFGVLTGEAEPIPVAKTVDRTASAERSPRNPGNANIQESRQAQPTTKREQVTLLEDTKGGKAQVRTGQGEVVVCTDFPHYPPAQRGRSCRADITRKGGKAERAIFKGWR